MMVDRFIWYVTGYGGIAGCPCWDSANEEKRATRGNIIKELNLINVRVETTPSKEKDHQVTPRRREARRAASYKFHFKVAPGVEQGGHTSECFGRACCCCCFRLCSGANAFLAPASCQIPTRRRLTRAVAKKAMLAIIPVIKGSFVLGCTHAKPTLPPGLRSSTKATTVVNASGCADPQQVSPRPAHPESLLRQHRQHALYRFEATALTWMALASGPTALILETLR